MILTGSIQIKTSGDLPEIEKYDLLLKTLLVSAEETIPGSRGFGILSDYISFPPQVAMNMFTVDLYEKAEKYIPEIEIKDITWTADELGNTSPTIYIGRRE